jgi:hypothetical protein
MSHERRWEDGTGYGSSAIRVWCTGLLVIGVVACGGCCGNARVELSSADSIEGLADALAEALMEYHRDLTEVDEARRRAVANAFVARVLADAADASRAEEHTAAFLQAQERIRADWQVEWQRYTAAMKNVDTLGEVASGLRRLAIESESFGEEIRRYFQGLFEPRR